MGTYCSADGRLTGTSVRLVNSFCPGSATGLRVVYLGISNTLLASLDTHDNFLMLVTASLFSPQLHLCSSKLPLHLGIRSSLNVSTSRLSRSAPLGSVHVDIVTEAGICSDHLEDCATFRKKGLPQTPSRSARPFTSTLP